MKKLDYYKISLVRTGIARIARNYEGQYIDCADVALIALAKSASERKYALSIPVWSSSKKIYIHLKSSKYPNTDKYILALRRNLHAMSLVDPGARLTKARLIDKLRPGDLIVYDLRYLKQSGVRGHTRIVLKNDSTKRVIEVIQGHVGTPVEKKDFTYKFLLEQWKGPFDGKGCEFNWRRISG